MMGRRSVLGILAGAATVALPGCSLLNSTASYRFRMTVEVDTPQGVKTGSSVMEVFAQKHAALTSEEGSGFSSGLSRAEAVVIETSNGPIFALLTRADDKRTYGGEMTEALAQMAHNGDWKTYMAAVKQLSGKAGIKAELPRAAWPMMVRFRDLGDPKSVERVEPATVGVTRILLETTDDAVTTGIEKRLPVWFGQQIVNRTQLSGKSSSIISTNELADNLGPGNFGTEIGK